MPNLLIRELTIPHSIVTSWHSLVDVIAQMIPQSFVRLYINSNSSLALLHEHSLFNDCPSHYRLTILEQQNQSVLDSLTPQIFHQTSADDEQVSYITLPIIDEHEKQLIASLSVVSPEPITTESKYFPLLANAVTQIISQFSNVIYESRLGQSKVEDPLQLPVSHYEELSKSLDTEIDRRKLVEQQLHYHKYHDLGTGFLNRFALEMEARKFFSQQEEVEEQLAIIHIGFSNARNLQTRFGYSQWEMVLRDFHSRIPEFAVTSFFTSRPNSTDLALLVKTPDIIHHVELICEQLVSVGKSEFSIEQQTIHLHSYIGISTSLDASSATQILEQASAAMLSCRESGHSYCYHSQALAESQSRIHLLENYLLHAVRNGDLMLHFQPKVHPVTKQWTGAEALLRWRHPVLGEISSETLIHLAEKNGLIYDVGSFVLRTAIEKASEWRSHAPGFKMAVNISAKQLRDVRFVDQVKALLDEYQLPAQCLEIEVTESGLITDEKVAGDILQVLHSLGITLSLDDFGTGYASFNYLKKFPFDCIKIDKSFIHPLEHSEDDKEIVRSIIQVAKKLKLQVIIEGVETKAQEAFVVNEGCDFGQGFLYGRPMPADDFEVVLINQSSDETQPCW